jgi:hypothetical protein
VEEMRNAYRVLAENPEGKRPTRRPRCRWESDIVMGIREVVGKLWTGFIWLRIGSSGRLL